MRLVRNTIHNNGVHRPKNGHDETVSYAGHTFEFKVGQQLGWMGDDFLTWLPDQLNHAMKQVVSSAGVSGLAVCPRLA